jgi:hypothetical protein
MGLKEMPGSAELAQKLAHCVEALQFVHELAIL